MEKYIMIEYDNRYNEKKKCYFGAKDNKQAQDKFIQYKKNFNIEHSELYKMEKIDEF